MRVSRLLRSMRREQKSKIYAEIAMLGQTRPRPWAGFFWPKNRTARSGIRKSSLLVSAYTCLEDNTHELPTCLSPRRH